MRRGCELFHQIVSLLARAVRRSSFPPHTHLHPGGVGRRTAPGRFCNRHSAKQLARTDRPPPARRVVTSMAKWTPGSMARALDLSSDVALNRGSIQCPMSNKSFMPPGGTLDHENGSRKDRGIRIHLDVGSSLLDIGLVSADAVCPAFPPPLWGRVRVGGCVPCTPA